MNITLVGIIEINQNIVKIYNKKNIEIFDKNLVNIILEANRNIKKTKKHYLILKMLV